MAGDHAYHKDLSHLTWEEVFRRTEQRAPLAEVYWRLAGGRPGARVADVGCGPGAFTLRYAAMTGPTGLVHAVDASPDALAFLRARLDPVHHAHVTTEMLDAEKTPLPDLHFHAVLLTDMLHHTDAPEKVLANLRATAVRLVIGEFDPDGPREIGPPLEERIHPLDLDAMLRRTGWVPDSTHRLDFEHYAVVARPA